MPEEQRDQLEQELWELRREVAKALRKAIQDQPRASMVMAAIRFLATEGIKGERGLSLKEQLDRLDEEKRQEAEEASKDEDLPFDGPETPVAGSEKPFDLEGQTTAERYRNPIDH